MTRMNVEYLVQSEEEVRQATHASWDAGAALLGYIDTLLLLPYAIQTAEEKNDDSSESMFRFWVFDRYVQAPYSFRALLILWERGYYAEATPVLRHILETFIQIRYFLDHRDRFQKHVLATTQRERVPFYDMFEEFSPGYYHKHYGRWLSGVSHAGLAALVFSEFIPPAEPSGTGTQVPKSGCEFSEKNFSWLMNQTLPLVYGYLNYFPMCFKTVPDADIETRRTAAMKQLEEWESGYRKAHPRAEEWLNLMDKIVR